MDEETNLGARLLKDTRGLTTVEYAIVLCLVAVAGIGVWDNFGETLETKIGRSNDAISTMGDEDGEDG